MWPQCEFRMQVWNVLHTARWKYRMQKLCKKIAVYALSHIFATTARIDNRKKNLLHSNISPTCPQIWWTSAQEFGAPQQISMGFGSWLHYCTDVAEWRSTKLCTMFGRVLGWYIIYTFFGALAPNRILLGAKFTLHPSLTFSYIGALLYSTQGVGVSKTLRHGIITRQGSHLVQHWAVRTV